MKKKLAAAAIVCLPLLLFFLLIWRAYRDLPAAPAPGTAPAPSAPTNAPMNAPARPVSALPRLPSPDAPTLGAAPAARSLQFTNFPPAVVLENVNHALRHYGKRFGGNPVGTNPEITAALAGANPGGWRFLDAEAGLRTNQAGELLDSWGTPFFFHQLSASQMEIRSAGPDGVLWTGDDLVVR